MKKTSLAGLAAAAALLAVAAFFGCKTEADEPSPAKKSPSVTIGAQTVEPLEGSATAAEFQVTIADISGVTSDTAITLTWDSENDPTPPPSTTKTAVLTPTQPAVGSYTHILTVNWLDDAGEASSAPQTGDYKFKINVKGTWSKPEGGQAGDWSTLHITSENEPNKTAAPSFTGGTEVQKTSAGAISVTLTLSAAYPSGSTAKIYDDAVGTVSKKAQVSLDGDQLVITSIDGGPLPAGDYWVTVSTEGLRESSPVKITISEYAEDGGGSEEEQGPAVDPTKPYTSAPALTYYAKALPAEAPYSVTFTITPAALYTEAVEVLVYSNAAGTHEVATPTAAVSGDTLTLTGNVPGSYYLRFREGDKNYTTTPTGVSIYASQTKFFLKFDGTLGNEFSNQGSPVVRNADGTLASPDFVTGKYGEAALHLSPGQYLDLGDGAYYGAAQDFTVAMWVKVDTSKSISPTEGGSHKPVIYASPGETSWMLSSQGKSAESKFRFQSQYEDSGTNPATTSWTYAQLYFQSTVTAYIGQSSVADTPVVFKSSANNFDGRAASGGNMYVGNKPGEGGAMAFDGETAGLDWYIDNLIIIPGRVDLSGVFAGTSALPASDKPKVEDNSISGIGVNHVDFTLDNAPVYLASTVWKVYDEEDGNTESSQVSIGVSGSTLTLTQKVSADDVPAGEYYIEATEVGKTASARLELIVEGLAAIESVAIKRDGVDASAATLDQAEKVTFTASVVPAWTSANYTWSSSDEDVATVNSTTGEVTAVTEGSITIQVSATNAQGTTQTDTITITVTANRIVWDWTFARDGGVSWSDSTATTGVTGTIGNGTPASAWVSGEGPLPNRSALNTSNAVSIKGRRYAARFSIGVNSGTTNSTSSDAKNSSAIFDFSNTAKQYKVFLTVEFGNEDTTKSFMLFVNNNGSGSSTSPLQDNTILNLTLASSAGNATVGSWGADKKHLESRFFTSTTFTAGQSTLVNSYIGFTAGGNNPATESLLPEILLKEMRIVEYPLE